MKTMFNFGDPHKDFTPIAKKILKEYKEDYIPITNNKVFYNKKHQIVYAAYGPSMVLDTLTMFKNAGRLHESDLVLFLGSMGALANSGIELDDLVIPVKVCNPYFGSGRILKPNNFLKGKLETALAKNKHHIKNYFHGSVYAVFDPSTDHEKYTNGLNPGIAGLDCSESYIALDFCNKNDILGAILLYCSDDPVNHIGNIPKKEFDKRALEKDLELHRIAMDVFEAI